MMLSQYAALLACLVLLALTVFQIALIFGAPLGEMAWGGKHKVLPTKLRVGSVIAIALYALFAAVLLERAGMILIFGSRVALIGAWVIAAYGAIGTGLNAISPARPERMVMTPVAGVLTVCALIVAVG